MATEPRGDVRRKRVTLHCCMGNFRMRLLYVVWPGRVFVRQLFNLSATVQKNNHHMNLNQGARSDLTWWHEFLVEWNGVSMLSSIGEQKPEVTLTSDASGSWGCGAYWGTKWFQLAWSSASGSSSQDTNIATKELVPIVIAPAMWGQCWSGCQCNNSTVVAVLNRRTSRYSDLMHLLRCLTFFEVSFSFRMISKCEAD